MLEALAFLAARLQKRMDEDHREVADALLQVLHPQATQPLPSAALLALEAQGPLSGPLAIPRGQRVLGPDTGPTRLKFRTCREVVIWPLRPQGWVLDESGSLPALILDLQVTGPQDLSLLPLSHLDFHLEGEGCDRLAEALLHRLHGIQACTVEGSVQGPCLELPAARLRPSGLEDREALLEVGAWDPPMLRLLLEWFTLPAQFQFLTLEGLDHPDLHRPARLLRLRFLLDPGPWIGRLRGPGRGPGLPSLRLGCTPVVNLFPVQADPILLTHRQEAYPLRVGTGVQVHRVTAVTWASQGPDQAQSVPPLAGSPGAPHERPGPFRWYLPRSGQGAPSLVLVEPRGSLERPMREILRVQTLCSQGDLPTSAAPPREAPWTLPGLSVPVLGTLLSVPTPWRPPLCDLGSHWRLVSHLSLALGPLAYRGVEGLQELISLHDPCQTPRSALQVEALEALTWQPGLAQVATGPLTSYLRGLDLHLTLDEARFGPGWILFAGLLDRVLAASLGVNRFHRLHVHPRQRPGEELRWPARTGLGLLT